MTQFTVYETMGSCPGCSHPINVQWSTTREIPCRKCGARFAIDTDEMRRLEGERRDLLRRELLCDIMDVTLTVITRLDAHKTLDAAMEAARADFEAVVAKYDAGLLEGQQGTVTNGQ